ncbi:CoA transferase [Candidatus Bathyarchaeota archaeon]|nr:MAG: CoA transferase [Candidatus Bathyarchaeota archaeon]
MQPLEGIRIIDLTHALAGPYGVLLLADLGADVIKVEPIEGDPFREAYEGGIFIAANRNKKSLALNLKTEEGRDVLRKLIKISDVIVENFTPGKLEEIGFGYEDVSKINPRIIYCSLSGFGQSGPYSKWRAFDPVIQAMCGSMAATGEQGGRPVRNAGSFIDTGTGVMLAYSILAALIAREKTGKGQRIDISLFESAVSWMNYYIIYYLLTGEIPEKMGTGYKAFFPYGLFETKDRPIYIAAHNEKAWKALCETLDAGYLLEDERFKTNDDRCRHRKELEEELNKILRKMSCDEVLERLTKAEIACGPLLTVADLVDNPHLKEREVFIKVKHPTKNSEVKSVGMPIKFSEIKFKLRYHPPKLGEHSIEILKDLGYSEDEIYRLKEKKIVYFP